MKNKINRKTLITKLKKIKAIITDVDGVLTGGEIIIPPGDNGDIKIWNVKDRLAFAMIRAAGSPYKLFFVTGRYSRDVSERAKELGITLYDNCADKKTAFEKIISSYGADLKSENVAVIGDDLIDIPMLRLAGLSICPSDAHNEVKKICDIVLETPGGKGAFREFAELLLKVNGLWRKAVSKYMD